MDRIYRHTEYDLIDLAGSRYFFRRFLACMCVFLIKFMHKAQSLYIYRYGLKSAPRCNASDACIWIGYLHSQKFVIQISQCSLTRVLNYSVLKIQKKHTATHRIQEGFTDKLGGIVIYFVIFLGCGYNFS